MNELHEEDAHFKVAMLLWTQRDASAELQSQICHPLQKAPNMLYQLPDCQRGAETDVRTHPAQVARSGAPGPISRHAVSPQSGANQDSQRHTLASKG